MNTLFDSETQQKTKDYTAKDIEILDGLEAVRRHPAMYIGGTDDKALHHLAAELLDNAMDEAVAGHASFIDISLREDGGVTIADNGRGIPVEKHPKQKKKSALEVILTTLHSGGKFSNKVYNTAGGLHGVGLSVVNALSEILIIEVVRDQKLWRQKYMHGKPQGPLEKSDRPRPALLRRFQPHHHPRKRHISGDPAAAGGGRPVEGHGPALLARHPRG